MYKEINNHDIEIHLKKYNIKINGIIMSNELNKLNMGFYVVNLDRMGGGGTHWTCLYFDNKINIYFDSYGKPPPAHISNLLKPIFIYNKEQIQSIKSTACGWYCIAWIRFMSGRGDKIKLMNIFNNLFNNLETNEKQLKFLL